MLDGTVLDWLYNAARWTWHDPDGYNFISGPLADITLLGGAYAILRRHNCHVHGCWRIGRAPVHGTPYIVCKKHHPHQAPTVEQVHAAHEAAMTGSSAQATAQAADSAARAHNVADAAARAEELANATALAEPTASADPPPATDGASAGDPPAGPDPAAPTA